MKDMTEDTYSGEWFLPDDDTKVQGKLKVTDMANHLIIQDADHHDLPRRLMQEDEITREYPIVYGRGRMGELFTLYRCEGFSGSYNADLALYGSRHFGPIDQVQFALIGLHLSAFDRWFCRQSFQRTDNSNGFNISYIHPEPIDFQLGENLKMNITFDCYRPQTTGAVSVRLNQIALVQFGKPNNGSSSLQELIPIALHFQQLVSLLARDGANISVVRAYTSENEFKQNKYLGTQVHGLSRYHRYDFVSEDHHSRFLISADKIPDLNLFFTNWFNFARNGQHILSIYFQDYFQKTPFNENHFLNMVRALEILHAYLYPHQTKAPQQQYEEMVNDMLSHLPQQHHEKLKEAMRHGNNPSLGQRLKALAAEAKGIKIGHYSLDKKTLRKITLSRNYYTHYDPVSKHEASSGKALEELTETCRALLNFSILKHLGIPGQHLKECFEHYYERSYYGIYYP